MKKQNQAHKKIQCYAYLFFFSINREKRIATRDYKAINYKGIKAAINNLTMIIYKLNNFL